ncbi:MAG TPA: ATP-binding cassette domain-containing protein [Actinomycetota bacterium]|nr:ATP-binding cassette domain-containing protein [Actinomycetota bacterium]
MTDPGPEILLRLRGATVWVPGGAVLLDRIDWEVAAGQHWALLGPNGAGKSTLLRLAAGLRHPSSGTVEVLGRQLGSVDVRTLWPVIGFVANGQQRPADLSIEEVVLTGASGTIWPLAEQYGPAERDRAGSLMELMGVGKLAGRLFATCSDGERGRALIARALMPAPRLLLLDEPTAGLDMAGREDLLGALSALAAAEAGLASVVVAHHLEDLPVVTSHALLIAAGATVAQGPVEEMLADAIVRRGFGVDVHVVRSNGRWMAIRPEGGDGAATDAPR